MARRGLQAARHEPCASGRMPGTTLPSASRRTAFLLHTGAAAVLWGCVAAACAQDAMLDRLRPADVMRRAGDARNDMELKSGSRFSIVDMSSGAPNERPRHALRMRFDSATRAMREWGIEAEDCSSLVRSNTRMRSSEVGGSERLQLSVSVALNCRFF